MYGNTIIEPVENDTTIEYSRDVFETYVSLNYDYVDSVL